VSFLHVGFHVPQGLILSVRGFKELMPKFAIRDAGRDSERLPTASTCVNLLKLPMYTDERILKAKLLQAINSGAGFDLS
jgi:ubiquitin-protein ligase E3 C